jgi:signal transduction histidine kinase
MKFETKIKTGYAALVTLLAVAMAYTIHRVSSVADEQVASLRAEEQEVTLAERLRWSSEFVVSTGRAYLLSGEPALFREVQNARARFAETAYLLRQAALSPRGNDLFDNVQDSATRFMEEQEQLITARRESADASSLVRRFDTELFPRSVALDHALARLVDHKEARMAEHYATAKAERARLVGGLYALLAIVTLAGVGIAWTFARLLGHSYRQEQDSATSARNAVAARDELLGIVAHDLRNPLGAITMRASMLRNEADSENTRQQAASIENVAMRMSYLIKTMLDVVTMEAGRFSLMRARCDIADLVREAMELFEPLAATKQVRLETIIKDAGLVTHADRERLLQVLSNLVGNALKFTPQGGQVTITVERAGEEARLGVLDTGVGIARDHLPRIFDRFWKHDTPGVKGTGLGLFIAKGIVEAHGGRMWVESEPGHGARFYFTLALEPTIDIPLAKTMPSPIKRGDG